MEQVLLESHWIVSHLVDNNNNIEHLIFCRSIPHRMPTNSTSARTFLIFVLGCVCVCASWRNHNIFVWIMAGFHFPQRARTHPPLTSHTQKYDWVSFPVIWRPFTFVPISLSRPYLQQITQQQNNTSSNFRHRWEITSETARINLVT